jgi:hypothetical protein
VPELPQAEENGEDDQTCRQRDEHDEDHVWQEHEPLEPAVVGIFGQRCIEIPTGACRDASHVSIVPDGKPLVGPTSPAPACGNDA